RAGRAGPPVRAVALGRCRGRQPGAFFRRPLRRPGHGRSRARPRPLRSLRREVTRVRRVAIASLVSSAEEVAHLGLLLSRGGVAAIPTETFYALAADPFNTDAVERIFRIKGREDGNPLPVLFANRLDLEKL